MPSANKVIFDKLVKHQINLRRLATGTVGELSKVLDKYDDRIADHIAGLHAGSSQADLEKAIRRIGYENENVRVLLQQEMHKHMRDLSNHEVDWIGNNMPPELKKAGMLGPSKAQIEDMLDNRTFNGAKMDAFMAAVAEGRQRRMAEAIQREHQLGGPGVPDGIRRAIIGSAISHFMDGIMGLSRRSLDQATRTVANGVANEARTMFYQENDTMFDGIMWVSVLDTRTSDICINLDGTVFPLDQGPRPPAHFNCRSDMTPIIKDWEALGIPDLGPGSRESLTGEVPETQTYPEWLKNQSAEIQDEVLGPIRGQMFRDGLEIDRFIDDTGKRYTLDQLRQMELGVDVPPWPRKGGGGGSGGTGGHISPPLRPDPDAEDLIANNWKMDTQNQVDPKRKQHGKLDDYVPEDDIQSLRHYTGSSYRGINGYLRDGPDVPGSLSSPSVAKKIAQQNDQWAQIVSEIDAEFKPTTLDYTGYRVVRNSTGRFNDLKIGAIVPNDGYVSTSRSARVAAGFADFSLDSNVMFKIATPAGTPAIVTNAGELEVILKHGSKMKVISKHVPPGGVLELPGSSGMQGNRVKFRWVYEVEVLDE